MGLPEITPEQRAAALEKAAEARRLRAEIKELLKTGSLSITDVFDQAENNDYVANMKVGSLLPSLPGMGKIKAKRFMEEHGIADNRRIRGLGSRQRAAILDQFA